VRSIKDLLNISTQREKNRGNLWAAVQARRIIEFKYHGSDYIVEPFAIGITRYGNPDNESLICYQTGGAEGTKNSEGWRLYRTSEIKGLKVSPEQFTGERPAYDPDNIDMVKVFCCVRPQKPAKDKASKTRPPPEVKPLPVCIKSLPPAQTSLSHNELMRQFRLKHPVSVSALYKNLVIQSPGQTPTRTPRIKK
jgi:hypothetical protein